MLKREHSIAVQSNAMSNSASPSLRNSRFQRETHPKTRLYGKSGMTLAETIVTERLPCFNTNRSEVDTGIRAFLVMMF